MKRPPILIAAVALVLVAAAILVTRDDGQDSTSLRADERVAGSRDQVDEDEGDTPDTTDASVDSTTTPSTVLGTPITKPVIPGRPRPTTSTTERVALPGYGPGRILYQRGGEVFSVTPDGSDVVGMGGSGFSPSWSPDHFSFAVTADGSLVVRDRYGRNDVIAPRLDQRNDSHVAWSPDGTLLATSRYEHSETGCCAIWVMKPDGSDAHRIADSNCINGEPVWTTDSKKVVFWSSRNFCDPDNARGWGNYELFIVNADGTGLKRLNTLSNSGSPSVSPDGTKVAFATDRDDHYRDKAGTWEIYVMNIDGSNQTRITNSAGDDLEPDWSSDGSRIAFFSARDGGGLFTMKPDGSNVQKVLSGEAKNPDW